MSDVRYLIYNIDKNQNAPLFKDVLDAVDLGDADDGMRVIVDLAHKTRYYMGEWEPVDIVTKKGPTEGRE